MGLPDRCSHSGHNFSKTFGIKDFFRDVRQSGRDGYRESVSYCAHWLLNPTPLRDDVAEGDGLGSEEGSLKQRTLPDITFSWLIEPQLKVGIGGHVMRRSGFT